METIQYIHISGKPFNMGLEYGEHFRSAIKEFSETRFQRLQQSYFLQHGQVISKTALYELIRPLLKWHSNYNSTTWEEFCGIAKASDISPEALLITMGYTDLKDFISPQKMISRDMGECSAFIVPVSLPDNDLLCGQTWDMSPEAGNYLVVVKRQPDSGPATLCLTTAGCLGLIGLNESGIAIGNTNLATSDGIAGVNYLFTISAALTAKSLESAVGKILLTPRLSGHNFFAANYNQAINIEASALQAFCTQVTAGVFVHTNHCLDTTLQAWEIPRTAAVKDSSCYRLDRMQQLFSRKKGSWTMEECWQILGDTCTNTAGAAISKDTATDNGESFITVASCIMKPKDGTMWVCKGGTSGGEKQVFKL